MLVGERVLRATRFVQRFESLGKIHGAVSQLEKVGLERKTHLKTNARNTVLLGDLLEINIDFS